MERTIVMKFGGASLASPEHFTRVAALIAETQQTHKRIGVVVSAMGNTTNQLIALAHQVHENPPRREVDMLVSVGERISMALLAMSLDRIGIRACSFTGSQSGIITCQTHGDAQIVDVRPYRLLTHMDRGEVVIVAGFQGVSLEKEITTLGRGGSDTSAVALGLALQAEEVRFYKDVEGVYSDDPKTDPEAQLFETLTYDEMEALALKGCKVLHLRAIRLAKRNDLPLRIRSFSKGAVSKGTLITPQGKSTRSAPQYEMEVVSSCLP